MKAATSDQGDEREMNTTVRKVYLDNAATTPLFPEVVALMSDYLQNHFGNPSSLHSYGVDAKEYLDWARKQAAELIHAEPEEIYFTSGGTEADNIIIIGTARRFKQGHIITSAVEHHAVLDTCKYLAQNGFDLTILPVDQYGMVQPATLQKAMRPDTFLVSIMQANNEVGTINPIAKLCQIAHAGGALFHTDAVQSVGKIPVDVRQLGVDFLSYSGHKINGPKGVGVLYKKAGTPIQRTVHGGGQERKLRSGTENMPGIVGLGKAAELTRLHGPDLTSEWKKLRDHLVERVLAENSHVRLNGHPTERLPHNAHFSFNFIEGEAILLHLDLNGIACSAGSACSSASLEPSHVLTAMGLAPQWSHSAIRFSLGLGNTLADIDYTADMVKKKVDLLRAQSPFYKGE